MNMETFDAKSGALRAPLQKTWSEQKAGEFSRVCSALAKMQKTWNCDDELASAYHAPSECWSDMHREWEDQAVRFFDELLMPPSEFEAELEARTSPRWVFMNCSFFQVLETAKAGYEKREERSQYVRSLVRQRLTLRRSTYREECRG